MLPFVLGSAGSSFPIPFVIGALLFWLQECYPTSLVVLITPPPVDEEGRKEYARYHFSIFLLFLKLVYDRCFEKYR